MSKNLYSKFITYATIVLSSDDMDDNIAVLEDVYDGKINVTSPFTITYAERNFKISDQSALTTFINAVRCTAELFEVITKRKQQEVDHHAESLREVTSAEFYIREYPNGGAYGIVPTDEIVCNWDR